MAVSQAVQRAFLGKPRDQQHFDTLAKAEAFKEIKTSSRCSNVRLSKWRDHKKPDGTPVYCYTVSWTR